MINEVMTTMIKSLEGIYSNEITNHENMEKKGSNYRMTAISKEKPSIRKEQKFLTSLSYR